MLLNVLKWMAVGVALFVLGPLVVYAYLNRWR